MKPGRIPNHTRIVGLEQRQYLPLPLRDVPDDNVPGGNVMWSMWHLTSEELAAINQGHPIMLGIIGSIWPPALIAVSETFNGD